MGFDVILALRYIEGAKLALLNLLVDDVHALVLNFEERLYRAKVVNFILLLIQLNREGYVILRQAQQDILVSWAKVLTETVHEQETKPASFYLV